MLKCSHSAPLKRPRARFARLSAEIEAAGKAPAEPKPRVERICAMRASPIRTKTARVECPSERKKALTTPRSKAVRPRQELFHSVKHQKEPLAAAARKGTVVKSLFMSTTPKKELVQTPAADKSKGAVSEVCSKLRKLNLACREVPSKYMSQPQPKNTKTAKKSEETTVAKSEKRGLESKTNAKKKILGRSMKRANAGPDGENRNGCSTAVDENSLVETAGSHQERKVVLQELRIEVDASRCGNSDDNKENVSSAPSEEALDNSSHYGSENRLLENNDNVPLKENVALKVAKLQKKVHQEQAGKLKKTTNPRVLWDGGVMRTGASPIHLSIVSNGSYGLMESWARVLDFFANVGALKVHKLDPTLFPNGQTDALTGFT
uniref:Uncharacterized protein n=1 Tax=Zea mays TaxID=4577 RepID=A0A804ULW3_MAIZE